MPHMVPWGKKIASYLWTKSISAGVVLLSALFLNMGFSQDGVVLSVISPAISLLFLVATMLLLVFDLKKPGRFFFLMTKANLNSWLTLGGYVLMAFGLLLALWLGQILPSGIRIGLVDLVDRAFGYRLGRLFRLSLRPGARARFLAKPIAVLAFDRSSDRRRRRCVDLDRRARIHHALSIHCRRSSLPGWCASSALRCWRAWR